MRERRRKRACVNDESGLDGRRVAAEVACLARAGEDEALNWIDGASEFDSPDPKAEQ